MEIVKEGLESRHWGKGLKVKGSQDILAYFNASLQRRSLKLPRYDGRLDRLGELKSRIEESLPRLSLTSEMARREFLIAPVLTDVLHYTQATLSVEYPVAVSNQLKGSLLAPCILKSVKSLDNQGVRRKYFQTCAFLIESPSVEFLHISNIFGVGLPAR